MSRIEWRGRADFAEIAEALGVTTEQVMAMKGEGPRFAFVLYTPSPEGDKPPVFRALLRRDDDGVLQKVREEEVTDFYMKMRGLMYDQLRDRFGSPESGGGGM